MNIKNVGIVTVIVLVIGGLVLFVRSNGNSKETEATQVTEANSLPSSEPTTVSGKTFMLSEVTKHATQTDCWMVIEDKVYDVTEYVSQHPGGKAIVGGCGKDATTLFNERPTDNKGPHPDAAKLELEKLYIGFLEK